MASRFRYLLSLLSVCIIPFSIFSQAAFPVRTSPDGRYLVDSRGIPFPVLGRTSWCVISQPADDYKTYIRNTVSHGFNSIEMSVICHWPQSNYPPHNGRGDLPFTKRLDGRDWNGSLVYSDINSQAPDFTKPDEDYWEFVDDFLDYCESMGILVFFFPAYLGYNGTKEGWMSELVANGPGRIENYGRWVATRYIERKNLVWMLLGDMGKFTPEQKEAEAALIAGLKSVAGQQSVLYSAEPGSGENSADQADFGDQMTLNGVYTWGQVSVPLLGRRAYSRYPVLPAYLLEEPYDEEGPDGNNFNPHAVQPVRRFQWWGWLTTVGGYMAGNGYIWPFIDLWWQRHLDTQGAMDMERLNGFIKSVRWWELVPSGLNGMKTLITSGGNDPGDPGFVAASANPSGSVLIAYIPPAHSGTVTVDMTAMRDKARARWYDPASGNWHLIEGSPFKNTGTHVFMPPGPNLGGDNDWVLMLDCPGAGINSIK